MNSVMFSSRTCGMAVILCAALCIFATAPAAARQTQLLDDGWRFHLNEVDGNGSIAPPGLAVAQWVWIADDSATNDAESMAAPGLDTSTWTNVTIGTDVFNGRLGYAWFRSKIVASSLPFQPATIYFSGVDDNAWIYLNGVLIGQHQGWSQPFRVSPLNPAWISGGTNVLAVAVQNTGGPGGIYAAVLLQSTSPQIQPPGVSLTHWLWLADANAPDDAAVQANPALDASGWQTALVGQDVFNGTTGSGWYRTALDGMVSTERPLTLHFQGVDDNATIYLNGSLLGRHAGSSQSFDIPVPNSAWSDAAPNVLAVAVQNNSGSGGITGPVIVQSGNRVSPPGIPVDQWRWLADSNAPTDAGTMAAQGLDASTWSNAAPGQDLFQSNAGAVWLRAALDSFATGGRPLTLHFLNFGTNVTANVYLNGSWLGQYGGAFDLPIPDSNWAGGGSNMLAVALQNAGGPGGVLNPVLLQSGEDIQDFSPADPAFDDISWRTVHLPHDYAVEGSFASSAQSSHASLPLANAWYRLKFPVPVSAQGRSVWLDFDGAYHNSMVWINGRYLGYWYSGYAPFRYDVSQYILPGQTNVIAVHLDPHDNEGWWYEGAGIYRHVWLTIADPLHVAPWGTFVTSTVHGPDTNGNASAILTLSTTITNAGPEDQSATLTSRAVGPDGIQAGAATGQILVPAGSATNVLQTVTVTNAQLWSLETPQLYELQSTVEQNGQTADTVNTPFGIRSIYFDVNNGFFLNGRHVEMKGTCNHQDFAGVGIGIPDPLLYWRIMKLKQMGANAYRCSHNPPTAALLDACDRLGMLVMDENRHLGDATGAYSSASAQTTYDDLSPLENMVLRDRNHPSVILWSMCNEESISGTQAGADIFYAMKKRVQKFDTSRPISCAMNGGWFNIGISLVEDVEGFNYSPGNYDSFHHQFPSQPMYASESASATTDRGMYTNDGVAYVSAYNSTTENAWQPVAARPFMAGAFVWTGFDYKGEPTPYGWPCVSSKFGAMDMCGLPKDDYYYYQAWWGDKPVAHLFPHWNWSAGQTITVWCYANTASVELFLNGVSRGVQTMPAYGHVAWSVPYSSGTLLARGYDSGGNIVATDQVVTTGSPAAIKLITDLSTLAADGEDVTVVYASIMDGQGRVVPTASNLVTFAAQGPGYIDGVGNGDPASHEPDKGSQRHAFNGWCMALVGSTNLSGLISLTATSPGLASATLNLQVQATGDAPTTPANLIATAGNAQASLRWDFNLEATSYNVERALAGGGPYSTIGNTTAAAFNDTGLSNGVTYYYRVTALNAHAESGASAEASVTPAAASLPSPPTALNVQRDDGQLVLTWNSSSGATGYIVKRALAGAGPYTNIASASVAGYTDSGLTNGITYFYKVSAVAGGIESADSAAASGSPASMSLLVGSSLGSTGSWNNSGDIRELALDGNLATFFDPSNADAWAGIDLGMNIARTICKIRYAPRSGYEARMVGGVFEGANLPDFSDAVALYTITNTPPDGFTAQFPTNAASFRYLRYLTAASNWCNLSEMEFYSLGPHNYRLSGTIAGTSGSFNNSGNTVTNAEDGDIYTFFDGPVIDGNWAGLDLGNAMQIANIRFFPRIGFASRMNGGIFQGANVADFSAAINLWTLTNTPMDSAFTAQIITNTAPFRYVRYLSPAGTYGDVGEIQFFGPGGGAALALPAPTGLSATPGNQEVALSWNLSSGAVTYQIKRSSESGGPYLTVATTAATLYMETGLDGGTYYYVVSAANSEAESANSAEAVATVDCPITSPPGGLATTAQQSGLLLAWSPVSTGTSTTTYNVLRSSSNIGPYALVASDIKGTDYLDATAVRDVNYYYLVEAVNACGQSANSASVGIRSLPVPQITAVLSGRQVVLSWPSWAGDYVAYVATNLAPPIFWQPLENSPSQNSNGVLYLNLPATNATQQFFHVALP